LKCCWPRRSTGLGLVFGFVLLSASLPRSLPAQQPTAGGDAPANSTPSKTQRVADLTIRYRFAERYTLEDQQVAPGVLGSCRVAIVEVMKDSFDNPQGAPRRTEETRQVIFTERPAEVASQGKVASVTRTFERFRVKPENVSKMMSAKPFEGLSLLIRPKLGDLPTILSLNEGRLLTDYEYDVAARQVFVAQLSSFLPTQVVRVGDTWPIPRKAAQSLLGDPNAQGDSLRGKLNEIRKDVDGPRMVASISITGKVTASAGEATINAEILFTFLPESAPQFPTTKPSTTARPADDATEARGAITELRMARLTSGPIPGPGRLRFQSNREVILHRQLGLVQGAVAPPKLEKLPDSTEANSWLTHVDPDGRYSLQHPQDLLLPDRSQLTAEANTAFLRSRREGLDRLQVDYTPKILTPDDLKKEMGQKYNQKFKLLKMEIIKGDEIWLPEAEWPKMRVHRIDSEVKVADPKASSTLGSTRIHFDGYLILFGQSASITVVSTTSRDAVAAYRQEVEKILKSIQLNPPRPVAN
jgi:hypothetical protein